MDFRHRLFTTAFAAMALTRADRWLAPLARGRGAILTFHHVRPWRGRRFTPNRLLEITPEYLDRTLTVVREAGFDLVPLDDVPARLAGAGERPFVALTFDDGYRDNVEHALPVLRRHGAPWTLFVTAAFAEGKGRLWWLELEEAIARLDHVNLRVGEDKLDLPAGTAREKARAFHTLYWWLRDGPEDELLTTIARLSERAGFDGAALAPELCLRWDELSRLAAEPGVTIGAHTLTHPMLAKHDEAFARSEIADSRATIAERLGVEVRHLAYPVGDPTSAGPREFAMAREAGFATAVTTRAGHVFAEHADHLHALPRVSVNGHQQTAAAMRALLSGAPFLAWNRGRRVNVS